MENVIDLPCSFTKGNDWISISSYAKMHGVSAHLVKKSVLSGNVHAMRFGKQWRIQKDEPYVDVRERRKNTI